MSYIRMTRHVYDDDENGFSYVDVVTTLGSLIWKGRNSRFGWLTPDGTLIGTGYAVHDLYARCVLNTTGEELEGRGWVKISSTSTGIGPKIVIGTNLTDAQASYLLDEKG